MYSLILRWGNAITSNGIPPPSYLSNGRLSERCNRRTITILIFPPFNRFSFESKNTND